MQLESVLWIRNFLLDPDPELEAMDADPDSKLDFSL
jgi:hypothetical protein